MELAPPRGTDDLLPPRSDAMLGLYEGAHAAAALRGFRYVEALVVGLILVIAGSFAIELWFARPNYTEVMAGFVPTAEILRNRDMLYIAIGILGATVMPHNLYLHSALVQTRGYARTESGRALAFRFAQARYSPRSRSGASEYPTSGRRTSRRRRLKSSMPQTSASPEFPPSSLRRAMRWLARNHPLC